MLTSHTKNTDGTYGPTANGKYYQSNPAHGINSINKNKTKWCISENQELSVFNIVERYKEELFCFENNCYFSIVNDGKILLGQTGERVAKFPRPSNLSDTWHGYPIKCNQNHNTPSDKVLDRMLEKKIISKTTRNRIERRKF